MPARWRREPRLLLLDEPAAGLNAQETDALAEIIQRINARGMTVLLIEHDMALVMRIAQRVAVLDFGRKIAEGTPDGGPARIPTCWLPISAARRPTMPDAATALLQSLVNGVGIGLVYGLIAIGFCVIYNASGIVNFAQGVFVMLGGMIANMLLTRCGCRWRSAAVLGRRSWPCIGVADAGLSSGRCGSAGAPCSPSSWRRSRCRSLIERSTS